MNIHKTAIPLALGCALAACDTPSASEQVRPAVERSTTLIYPGGYFWWWGGGGDCPTWGCGLNSPFIGHELSLTGEPNGLGVQLDGLRHVEHPDGEVFVKMEGDELRVEIDGKPLVGSEKVGLVMELIGNGGDSQVWMEVVLVEVGYTVMWADGQQVSVPTYKFMYRSDDAGGKGHVLCPESVEGEPQDLEAQSIAAAQLAFIDDGKVDEARALSDGALDGAYHAVLFAGDRFEFEKSEVQAVSNQDWVNWGCLGSSAAKLHLTGHTKAADLRLQRSEPIPENVKQAALYAFTATYCPGSESMTRPGHPIRIADYRGSFDRTGNSSFHPKASGSVEGLWSENGLECLTTPRLLEEDGDIWGKIAANCPIPPSCDDRDAMIDADMSGELLSQDIPFITFNLAPDSCQDRCGSFPDEDMVCGCDGECWDRGDCCDDYGAVCSP